MERNTERVLKNNDVEVSGRVQLPGISPADNNTVRAAQPSLPAAAAIVENTADFALIEVTCVCGRKTVVKCEYKAAE